MDIQFLGINSKLNMIDDNMMIDIIVPHMISLIIV